jgi:hypothetical protein
MTLRLADWFVWRIPLFRFDQTFGLRTAGKRPWKDSAAMTMGMPVVLRRQPRN